VGTVIGGDFIYEQIAQDLLQSNVLLREIHEAIEEHRKGGGVDGELRARLCSLSYLIGRLPREQGADIGLRASAEALADLLVEDLQAGSALLRNQVSASLEQMAETGKLMKIGDEYRLQTKQSSVWEGDFQERRSRLLQDGQQQIASLRSDRLKTECEGRLKEIRLADSIGSSGWDLNDQARRYVAWWRERGHRRLDARTYQTKCVTCIRGCRMPVEMIVDQWNPSQKRYRFETFCYGPKSRSSYRAGATREVPGRRGMVWEEEDWVDEDAAAHRGEDE